MEKNIFLGSARKFIRSIVAGSLKQGGNTVTFGENSAESIRLLTENPVNLIIVDLDNFHGAKPFISHLQSSPSLSRIPLVVVYSKAFMLADSGAEMSDSVAYLHSPFSSEDLAAAIKNAERFYMKSV